MSRHQSSKPELRTTFASLGAQSIVILTVFFAGGAIARQNGLPMHWGSFAALSVITLANLVQLMVQELPRQGWRLLFRVLVLGTFVVGWSALIWSAMQVQYGQWAVFYGSLHVLLTIGLVLLCGWATGGRAVSAVVFGKATEGTRKGPAEIDDEWTM